MSLTDDIVLPDFRKTGEVVDRLAVLRLKLDRFTDAANRRTVEKEYSSLSTSWEKALSFAIDVFDGFRLSLEVNRSLWDLENYIRGCEARGSFGEDFFAAISKIQSENRRRAQIRSDNSAHIADAHSVELVEVDGSLDTYVDRIAIGQVADDMLELPGRKWEIWQSVWLDNGLPDLFRDDDYMRLRRANSRLWTIKDELDLGIARKSRDAAYTNVCRSLYLVNDARCRLKEKIAVKNGSHFWDPKEYSFYETPTTWDHLLLDWVNQTSS